MSQFLPWGGSALTMEQEFVRLALALADVNQNRFIDLDNYDPKTTEQVITVTQGIYRFATSNKNRLIVVGTMPLVDNYAQISGKPWNRVAEISTDAIPAGYGAP